MVRRGLFWNRQAWRGSSRQARCGGESCGQAGQGRFGGDRCGLFGSGPAGQGLSRQARSVAVRHVADRSGTVWMGMAGRVGRGEFR